MSGRQWRAGDVAMVKCGQGPFARATFVPSAQGWGPVEGWRFSDGSFCSSEVAVARPVLVIDPNNADHVIALVNELPPDWGLTTDVDGLYDMARSAESAAAISEAIIAVLEPTATPRPSEPTGLGAVIADPTQNGRLYVRHKVTTNGDRNWLPADGRGDRLSWNDSQRPEVRGEGIAVDKPVSSLRSKKVCPDCKTKWDAPALRCPECDAVGHVSPDEPDGASDLAWCSECDRAREAAR